jgi:nitroreductase
MMLAAHALGIGSCWIGSSEPAFRNEILMAEFLIPDGYIPIGTIAYGYPAESPVTPNKKLDIRDSISLIAPLIL